MRAQKVLCPRRISTQQAIFSFVCVSGKGSAPSVVKACSQRLLRWPIYYSRFLGIGMCHFFFQIAIVHFGVFVSQQVDASLVCFVPRITPLIDAPFVVVEQIVKAIFSERRKTIRNSLR